MFRMLTAMALVAAFITTRADAAIIYTFTGDFTSLYDASFNPAETSTATFTVTTSSAITVGGNFVPTSSGISGLNSGGLFLQSVGQTIDPNGFGSGLAFVGLNTTNGSSFTTGYYFFSAGALSANGTYSVVTGPITGAGPGGLIFDLGNAGDATLTVSGIGSMVAVPEPMSLALFGAGLIGLAAIRRRAA